MKIAVSAVLLLSVVCVQSQTIEGTVIDNSLEPVVGAVVCTVDSAESILSATTTDANGKFSLNISAPSRMRVSHIAYETYDSTVTDIKTLTICLIEKNESLGEVSVVAHAPTVTVGNDGGLIYNMSKAKEQKAVSSAFDLLKEIPGVKVSADDVSLSGASNLTLIVDGKASSMSNGQIVEMLKSMSSNDVKNIEVMYRAPAKYGVHGATINIVKDKTQKDGSPLAMELAPEFEQEYYSSFGGRLNATYSGKKLYADFFVSGWNYNINSATEETTIFNYQDNKTSICQKARGKTDLGRCNIRFATDYKFSDDNTLSAYYYAKQSKFKSKNNSTDENPPIANSATDDKEKFTLQNANLKLQLHNFEISADYVGYVDDDNYLYNGYFYDSLASDYRNNSSQEIKQGKININYDKDLSEHWTISAGMNGTATRSNTHIDYLFNIGGNEYLLDDDSRQHNQQDERRVGFYAETSNILRDSIKVGLTMEVEYFNSDYDNNGTKTNLWREWCLFPSLSVVWPVRRSMLQLSISTNKRYPAYWIVNPQSKQENAYSYIVGNPQLKPETRYDADFSYIIRKRYTLSAFCSYRDEYFCQLSYADAETGNIIFQYTNFDKYIKSNIEIVVPVTLGLWDAEFSLSLIDQYCKHNNFHGNSFTRNKLCYAISADNTFVISKEKPNLSLTMFVGYVSKCIQGPADLNESYDFDLGLRWAILKNLVLNLSWNDILEKSSPWPMVTDFNGQYDSYSQENYNNLNVSLVWRIGGFKPKKISTTNTSRIER